MLISTNQITDKYVALNPVHVLLLSLLNNTNILFPDEIIGGTIECPQIFLSRIALAESPSNTFTLSLVHIEQDFESQLLSQGTTKQDVQSHSMSM
jgi:hypothetical protein